MPNTTLPAAVPSATMPSTVPTPPPGAPAPLAHYLTHPGTETGQVLRHLVHVAVAVGTHAGPPVLGAALAVAVAVTVLRRRQAARLARGARVVHVLAPPEVEPEGAATLWSNLVALLRPAWRRAMGAQPHLGFELVAADGGLSIALWVPGTVPPGLVERAVEAAWPGARTETSQATPPLPGSGVATGGELRLAAGEQYPLRTEHRVDPLRPLLGALSGLREGERACVQVLARPVTGRRVAALHKAAVHRRNGRPASRFGRLAEVFLPGPGSHSTDTDPARGGDVSAILDKAGQPCWTVTVRYGVATEDTSRGAAAVLRGRAHAIASAFAVFSGRNHLDRHRLRHPGQALAARRLGKGSVLSVAELAALCHLPTDVTVAGLARAGAKAVAPPPEVAQLGLGLGATNPSGATVQSPAMADSPVGVPTGSTTSSPTAGNATTSTAKVLGDAEAGSHRPVALAVTDARYHLHVMGATGSGKSTLMTNLVLSDVEAGRGVVVIDPKGDLITDLLERLPPGAESRTVLIDPEEHQAPPVMNVLSGADPDLVVDNLVGIFRNIFAAFWGPRTDDIFRASCLTLLRHEAATGRPASLADVPRLLADDGFRAPRVATVAADTVGLGGFWSSYEAMSEANRAVVVGPLMNKLRAFLLRDFVRQVVGRPESSFDMGRVLDEGHLCLVRVPKGTLGEETVRLLGSFVVAAVWQAATHRARLGQKARRDAALYVDECQNFLTLPRSFEEMLAEARGYGLSLVLAHQHLAQLPRDLREGVSANARTKLFFSMSPEDAHALGRHVAPALSEHDLAHLGAYQAAARLVVGGQETAAFTLRTRPAPAGSTQRADEVRVAARAAFGKAAEKAEGGLVLNVAPEEMAPEEMTPDGAQAEAGRP